MAYGFELTNKNGEVLFTTEEPYSVLRRTSSYTNTSSDGAALPTPAAGELVFARPQDGESGVIASTVVTTYTVVNGNLVYDNAWKMFGQDSRHYAWGTARGHKRFTAKGISTQITAPSTSGYGFECYDTNGDVVFSSETPNVITVEAAFELPFGDTVQYKNPTGAGDFDNLYVLLPGVIYKDIGGLFSGFELGGKPGPEDVMNMVGAYAYFNDSTEEITIYANGNGNSYNNTAGVTYDYEDLMQDNGSGFYYNAAATDNFVMIVRVNE